MNISPVTIRPAITRFGSFQTPDQEVAYWKDKVSWVTKRLDDIDFSRVSKPQLESLQAKLLALNPVFEKLRTALAQKQASK